MRGLPKALKAALERVPKKAHPMDVLRTGVSVLGTIEPEKDDHGKAGAQRIADRLMASMGSMLLYWYHYSHHGKRIDTETDDDSIGGHFPAAVAQQETQRGGGAGHAHLAHPVRRARVQRQHLRLPRGRGNRLGHVQRDLRRHRRAARPKHGGANEFAFEVLSRYKDPDDAEADIVRRVQAKEIVIGFGHPVYTTGDPRNQVIKGVAKRLSQQAKNMKLFDIAERLEHVMWREKEDVRQPRLVQRGVLPPPRRAHRHVHAGVRDLAHQRLVGARHRAARRRQDHPPGGELHRPENMHGWTAGSKGKADVRIRP